MSAGKIRVVGFLILGVGIMTFNYLIDEQIVSEETLQGITFVVVFLIFVSIPILMGLGQRKIKILPHIEKKLQDLDYDIISERPLNVNEIIQHMTLTPGLLFNGFTNSSLKNKTIYHRIFRVKSRNGNELELYTIVYNENDNTYKVEMKSKRSV